MEEEIKNSIKNALLKGVSREEVVEILKNAGWSDEKINSVLSEIGGETETIKTAETKTFEQLPPQSVQSSVQPSSFPVQPTYEAPFPSVPTSVSSQDPLKPLFDSQGRKICPYCGTPLKENSIYCPNCGRLVLEDIDSEKRTVDKKGFALASLIFGILGFVPVFALLGIIFGFIGRKSSRKGFAIAGIVLSCIFLVIVILFNLLFLNAASRAVKTVKGIDEIVRVVENKNSYLEIKEEKKVKDISKEIEKLGVKDFAINVHPAGKSYCVEAKVLESPERWYCVDSQEKKGVLLNEDSRCDLDYFRCK